MKLNKYQQGMLRQERREANLSGKGLFVYRNNTSGELFLPRPTKSGQSRVKFQEEFQGDDYYMYMVRNNELRLVKQIESAQPAAPQVLNENSMEKKMDDKLITEQPPTVTNEGTIEYVSDSGEQIKLNESQPQDQKQDVLLNENPLDGVEIL